MKVNKFTKVKNSMYKLTLEDGSSVNVHEDIILEKDILLNKKIDDDILKKIDILNNNKSAYDIAIKYISSKLRSIYDTYCFLEKKEIEKDVIHDVIERLKNQKYLDDHSYAKAFVNDRILFSNNGPYKIRRELEEQRVSSDIIDDVLFIFNSAKEKEKLEKLVPKYVHTIRNKSYVMMKSKVFDYFNNLGYSKNIVESILNEVEYDDSDIKNKEYEKLKKKYSRKYSGEELEFKIKQALYKNGFR